MMKHLASYNLVKEVGKDSYVGTPFSKACDSIAIKSALIYSFDGMIPVNHGLPGFLEKTDYKNPSDNTNGPVQFGLKTEKPFFGYLQDHPHLGSAFNTFMTGFGESLPKWYNFYPVQEKILAESIDDPLLVDVGGGHGHHTTGFVEKFPSAKGKCFVQDQPKVIEETLAMAKLPDNVVPIVHDFFKPQPESCRGAKIYYLSFIIHDWPEEQCKVILSHVCNAMTKGYSKLLIHETVLHDTGAFWQQTALDITMMGLLTAQERTTSDWKALLESVGLKLEQVWNGGGVTSVIEAVLA